MYRLNEYDGDWDYIARQEEIERSEECWQRELRDRAARAAAERRIEADFLRGMDMIDGAMGAAIIDSIDSIGEVA